MLFSVGFTVYDGHGGLEVGWLEVEADSAEAAGESAYGELIREGCIAVDINEISEVG